LENRFFLSSVSPANMAISCFFCCLYRGANGWSKESRWYVWQGFVAENPVWSPILELATSADMYT